MADLPLDLRTLPAAAQKLLGEGAPVPAKMMAARGIVPGLKPGELVTVVALLSLDADPKVAELALGTLRKLPPPVLNGALVSDLHPWVIEQLADHYSDVHDVVEQLLRLPRLGGDALQTLAQRADERMGELIATNEQRMLQFPVVIEKLYMNKRVRMSTSDRLLELAVRHGLELNIPAFKEAAQAIANELIAEPTAEPTFDDILFQETEKLAEEHALVDDDDDTHEVDDEGEERVRTRFLPLHQQIAQMTVSQKIRRATLGTAAERLLLVRDRNRLVTMAVVKSPAMRDAEAARITASRSVGEDILREIAKNREFTRNYQVKLNLVQNPRTPLTFSSSMIPLLRESDLRALAKSKNIAGAVSTAVRQHLERKSGAKRR